MTFALSHFAEPSQRYRSRSFPGLPGQLRNQRWDYEFESVLLQRRLGRIPSAARFVRRVPLAHGCGWIRSENELVPILSDSSHHGYWTVTPERMWALFMESIHKAPAAPALTPGWLAGPRIVGLVHYSID